MYGKILLSTLIYLSELRERPACDEGLQPAGRRRDVAEAVCQLRSSRGITAAFVKRIHDDNNGSNKSEVCARERAE